MKDRNENIFQICPKCHIGYDMININLFDHILKCDGDLILLPLDFILNNNFIKKINPLNKL